MNLQYRINTNDDKLIIITKDMESLLNNDKLLLDKLIEKNIVSTIQEEENVTMTYESSNRNSNYNENYDDIYHST